MTKYKKKIKRSNRRSSVRNSNCRSSRVLEANLCQWLAQAWEVLRPLNSHPTFLQATLQMTPSYLRLKSLNVSVGSSNRSLIKLLVRQLRVSNHEMKQSKREKN